MWKDMATLLQRLAHLPPGDDWEEEDDDTHD